MRYGAIGRDSRHFVSIIGTPRTVVGVRDSRDPFATTVRDAGAITLNDTVALSLGWSTVGSHWRARSGQLSPNHVQRPTASFRTTSPSETMPSYVTPTRTFSPLPTSGISILPPT